MYHMGETNIGQLGSFSSSILFFALPPCDQTENVRDQLWLLEDSPIQQFALETLAQIETAIEGLIDDYDLDHPELPNWVLHKEKDGRLLLEWVFDDLCFSISIGANVEESLWRLSTNTLLGSVSAEGRFSQDKAYLLAWVFSLLSYI